MTRYNLAVVSKVPLSLADSLENAAIDLGKEIVTAKCCLLTLTDMSLGYKVAQNLYSQSGLSIGFSPAQNYRHHIIEKQLPTDAYSFIYFSKACETDLVSNLINNSQALILIGSTMDNIIELSISLKAMHPIGVLVDGTSDSDQFIKYISSLPADKQKRIVINDDPVKLFNQLMDLLNQFYKDLNFERLDQNNKLFRQIYQEISHTSN